MFYALARFSYRYRWPVLAFYAILVVPAAIFGGSVFSALQPGGYDDPSTESFHTRKQLAEKFQIGSADLVPLYSLTSGNVKNEGEKAAIGGALDRAARDPSVERIVSFYNTGAAQLVSPDNAKTFAVVSLRGDDKSKIEALDRLKELLRANGVQTQFGGEAPVFEALNKQSESDLRRGELIAFPITAVLLILIFGSVVSAAVPLVMGGLAIVLALAVIRAIALVAPLSAFALNVITVLGLGLAIDYSLFILSRYREELRDREPYEAIVTAVGTAGRAAAFSGVTLAASLIGLFVFPQVFLRSMAIGGIAVTLIAVLIATTFLPAVVGALGPKIDLLQMPWKKKSAAEPASRSGFWHTLAMGVMRRPVVVAVAVVALLLLFGYPFLHFRPTKQDYRALASRVEAREVSAVLDSQFLPHETTPINVALTADRPMLTAETVGQLFDYVVLLRALPGVSRVDSLFSIAPGQSREAYQRLFTNQDILKNPVFAAGLALFVNDTATRMSLVSVHDFDAPQALDQVADVRGVPTPPRVSALVGGNSADLVDTKQSIRDRAPLTLAIIGVVTFLVLFLVYGSVVLPFKAMLMNLLSLTAAAGIVVWIFQDGRFQGILGYTSLGTLDVTLPILLFGIVFGLSMDYEVLMLSRVREEYDRTGDNTLAVALGLEKTGRLITSAAALLIVVILAFATSSLTLIKAIGVGMALAIAIDATIVRALLVPATMRLMGDWNWWAPAPLKRLWERIGLGDLEGHAAPPTSVARPLPMPAANGFAPIAAALNGAPAPLAMAAPDGPTPAPTVAVRRPPRSFAYLVQTQGADPGAVLRLEEGGVTIGRDPRNALVLGDALVSSNHARIALSGDGGYILSDLGSTNGTALNGQPLTAPHRLQDGDTITIGGTVLAAKIVEPASAVSARPEPVVAAQRPSNVSPTIIRQHRTTALAYFVETAGAEAGRVLPLTGDRIAIGRDPRNTIVLGDENVSGFHARILRGLDGGLVIEDRQSTNGTFVNDQAVVEARPLVDDDLVQLGTTMLLYKPVS